MHALPRVSWTNRPDILETKIKEQRGSMGSWIKNDIPWYPMMLFLVLFYEIEGFAFAQFCTARSICLSWCRIFGAPDLRDLGFGVLHRKYHIMTSSHDHMTANDCYWYLLISNWYLIDCWSQNQFKIALWEALAACSMLLKVIAWSTLCLMSQASFEYFGMLLSCCQKRQCSWSWWDHLERIRGGYLHSSTMAVLCVCQAWSASTSARNCLCQFLHADATALWLMSVCLNGSQSKLRCFKPAGVFGHCIPWCFDSQAGCDYAGQFISVTRLL